MFRAPNSDGLRSEARAAKLPAQVARGGGCGRPQTDGDGDTCFFSTIEAQDVTWAFKISWENLEPNRARRTSFPNTALNCPRPRLTRPWRQPTRRLMDIEDIDTPHPFILQMIQKKMGHQEGQHVVINKHNLRNRLGCR